jgi:hypothetical protein
MNGSSRFYIERSNSLATGALPVLHYTKKLLFSVWKSMLQPKKNNIFLLALYKVYG